MDNSVSQLWRSPWTSWIGFRYLKSKKNSKFLSFITFISISGVALGVTAMIVILSVMEGFEGELKKRLMSSDLHILITPTHDVTGFENGFVPKSALEPTGVLELVKSHPELLSFWPMVSTEAILRTGRKVTGVVLKGITSDRLARLKSSFTETAEASMLYAGGSMDGTRLPSVFLGQELAFEMGVIPGDMVTLVSPTETEGPLASVPRLKRFVVEAIYHSGTPEQELHTVYAKDTSVRQFLRKSEVVSQWEVTLRNFDAAPKLALEIKSLAEPFRVEDWRQLNAHLFASLRLERGAMFVILAFIIIVASFNIITTLTLMVLEKKREISILKAMGAMKSQIAAVFLSEGLLIGGLGVGSGVALGLFICSALRRYEFIQLPEIYYDRTLPVSFDPVYYTLVAVCAFLIVLAACLYPSKKASEINPLDGIRFG
jgi:lipoprotein-releasing system permease protein